MYISIITAVYNNSTYIQSSISSFVSQNFTDSELIIIDGGSTDGTIDIIKKNLSDNIQYISEPDRGVYDAMNKGTKFS